jgi:hypothetical protein
MTLPSSRPAQLADITVEMPARWTDEQTLVVPEFPDGHRSRISVAHGDSSAC